MTQLLDSPEKMEAAGASLIKTTSAPTVIFLRGNLGAGRRLSFEARCAR